MDIGLTKFVVVEGLSLGNFGRVGENVVGDPRKGVRSKNWSTLVSLGLVFSVLIRVLKKKGNFSTRNVDVFV